MLKDGVNTSPFVNIAKLDKELRMTSPFTLKIQPSTMENQRTLTRNDKKERSEPPETSMKQLYKEKQSILYKQLRPETPLKVNPVRFRTKLLQSPPSSVNATLFSEDQSSLDSRTESSEDIYER